MKPLTNEQVSFLKYVDDMNARHIKPGVTYLQAALMAINDARAYRDYDWYDKIFWQGILDYLTWPRLG